MLKFEQNALFKHFPLKPFWFMVKYLCHWPVSVIMLAQILWHKCPLPYLCKLKFIELSNAKYIVLFRKNVIFCDDWNLERGITKVVRCIWDRYLFCFKSVFKRCKKIWCGHKHRHLYIDNCHILIYIFMIYLHDLFCI